MSCSWSHFPKNSWEPSRTPLQTSSWEGLLTAPQELFGDEDKRLISAHAPNAVILKDWGVTEKRKGRSVWVNHSCFMGALWKGPFSLGLPEMSVDLLHGKRKLGGVSILKFRRSAFEFCVRVQVGYWSFSWDKSPSPSLAYTNCASRSGAWSSANLSEHSVLEEILQEGGWEAEDSHTECWTAIHWHMSQFGFGGCVSQWHSAHVAF